MIRTDRQWRIARAKEAFYGKVNQSALRKPPAQQTSGSSSSSSALPRQTFKNLLQLYWQQQQQQQALSSKDSNTMNINRNWAQHPQIKCYSCNKEGHMAHDCKLQRSIRVMTQKEIWNAWEYLDEQEAAVKDAAEIKKKEDFPAAIQWSHSHWSCKISFII